MLTPRRRQQKLLSIIVPVYNEQDVICDFLHALVHASKDWGLNIEIIIINDASKDSTLLKLKELKQQLPIKIISFSRNFGKECALTAGLEHCKGDMAVLVDADFQHPLEVIPEFIQAWEEGYDMVYGVRQSRGDEKPVKRWLTHTFYRLFDKITPIDIPRNAGDFRLLDRKVIDAMNKLQERQRYMKGLYAWVGFNSKSIYFTVQQRAAGTSSWSFFRLLELALTGITSFSDVPLRVWSIIGAIISLLAFVYGSFILIKTLVIGSDLPGFATLIVAIMFLGGIQLLSVGILGEYISRIFNEVKQRPKYIVAESDGFDEAMK